MGDLSGTRCNMDSGRVFLDPSGRKYRIKEPEPLQETPENLRIARETKPWAIYFRMLGTVLPSFFLMYSILSLILGFTMLEPAMILASGLCSAPLVFLILRLHRPRLVHVRLAVPDESGSQAHALPGGLSLRTPMKTSLSRFLVKDDSILDVPPIRQLWTIFGLTVAAGILIALLILTVSEIYGQVIFILMAIPLWLIGFSLPVLAWWGTSNKLLGLPTRRRDAESWLMAGMASAFPAFIFNSLIAPELVPFDDESWASELSLLAIGAPFCEEIFKAMAVFFFLPTIKGPKHGFQIGFTVGLGFALIENLQYIGVSVFGGPVAASLTILVRGIGSIPGHAIWTSIAGTAIGWKATDSDFKAKLKWKAKSLAISAIDLTEGLGLDMDGDGDLSGFDGSRPTLEEALSQSSAESPSDGKEWSIIGSANPKESLSDTAPVLGESGLSLSFSNVYQNNSSNGIATPRGILPAIVLAIAGHSFWNGSSYLMYLAPTEWLGMSEIEGVTIVLTWTAIMISSLLLITRSIIRGVNSLE
ncbi:MAG: hypothetical protein CMB78_01315 [Euryarchaeota archaeon]|nr:hypothetical protein [Euryarchaeota archaeon]